MREIRDCKITFRLTNTENENVKRLLQIRGLTVSFLIRELINRELIKEGIIDDYTAIC